MAVALLLSTPVSLGYFRPPALRCLQPLRFCAATLHSARCGASGVRELRLGRDVEIRASDGKGEGAFALRDLPAQAAVGRYDGILQRNDDTRRAYEAGITSNDYAFNLGNGWVVDGEFAERSNWLRYINHSRMRANCVVGPLSLCGITYGIYIKTSLPVKAGEELLFDYGIGAALKLRDRIYPFVLDPRRILWDLFE